MSHNDSNVVIPACPESIFKEGLPTSGSDGKETISEDFHYAGFNNGEIFCYNSDVNEIL